MRFWDASALVPLCVKEESTPRVQAALQEDPEPVVWAFSRPEILSALARRHREGRLSEDGLMKSLGKRDEILSGARIIEAFDDVLFAAERLLLVHPLRTADSFQLAAALLACEDDTAGHAFLTFDERLRSAARKEGFAVPLELGRR